jgi:tRNA nucleotidyltransferase/poly(A) polymerase
MEVNQSLVKKIKELEDLLGLELYLVGGAVRNLLLGLPPKDFDFTTPSHPAQIEEAIRKIGKKPYIIGKKFGTLGMKYNINNVSELIEITTFRSESYLADNRKPLVTFDQNIEQDLGRRDFTINALAIDSKGKLIDLVNGVTDIEAKIIKTVGSPKQRFSEDPLRILRAMRIATQLNFNIDTETWSKICAGKFGVLSVSKERWVVELDLILSSKNVRVGLNLLMDSGVLGVMIPELGQQKNYDQNTPYHDFTLWEHTLNVVEAIPIEQLDLRWTALLHDVAKPFTRIEKANGYSGYHGHELLGSEMSRKICQYLKFSKSRTDFICETIKYHLKPESPLKQYDDGGKKIYPTVYN